MKVTIQQLQIFSSVALSKSFSSARKTTKLSQPAISQSIAKLEKELNTQLFIRGRRNEIALTPSGEFWVKESKQILDRIAVSLFNHEANFSKNLPVMRFGVTPSLRGNFTKTAARITTEDGGFGRFDLIVSVNSNELIDLLLTHNITAAIVNEQSIIGKEDLFNITNLFTEEFVWAVPKEIHPDKIKKIILGKFNYEDYHDALKRYVEVNQARFNNISTRNDNLFNFQTSTDEWYRMNLSLSTPFYRASTYRMAIDFVAEGLATCHCPFSLIQGLEVASLEKINWVRIRGIKRTVVLAMPKHVISLSSFKKFRDKLIDYSKESFNESEVSKITLDIDQ